MYQILLLWNFSVVSFLFFFLSSVPYTGYCICYEVWVSLTKWKTIAYVAFCIYAGILFIHSSSDPTSMYVDLWLMLLTKLQIPNLWRKPDQSSQPWLEMFFSHVMELFWGLQRLLRKALLVSIKTGSILLATLESFESHRGLCKLQNPSGCIRRSYGPDLWIYPPRSRNGSLMDTKVQLYLSSVPQISAQNDNYCIIF